MEQALRRAIEKSGMTDSELAAKSGVAQPVIWRFRTGERSNLMLVTVDKLAAALGLELRER